ncbi:MAG: radical SAM protein [Myxococcales bacterium]|nr:radical SAM protein [Myxococcales bacterium]
MVEIVEEIQSRQNRRFVVRLDDGARVESVLYRGDTLCVSSQVGCAVGCRFCASGANGFGRNLRLEELEGQLEAVLARGHLVRRATLSGIGEPLHNFAVAAEFIDSCRARTIKTSLTTSGGPLPRLRQALGWLHNGLTLSVHAGYESTRRRLLPQAPPLGDLFATLAEVLPSLSRSRQKKIALSYLLMAGENDSEAELDAFAARARPLGLTLHLYAYNPVAPVLGDGYRRLPRERYDALWARLTATGLRVRMSATARIEENGGCGTLVALRSGRGSGALGVSAPIGSPEGR